MNHPPLIALVGRPNVGKSTLFNRLIGRRTALVFDEPGVTRDRIFGEAHFSDGMARLVDTGGLTRPEDEDALGHGMMAQTQLAIEEADLIIFVVDVRAGITPADAEVADHLRRSGKATIVAANKADVLGVEPLAAEFYGFGFDTVCAVSAEHNRGFVALDEAIAKRITLVPEPVPEASDDDDLLFGGDHSETDLSVVSPEADGVGEDAPVEVTPKNKSRIEWAGTPISVAVVGRPNAGKSSLINCILGEQRMLASAEAGTTRDPIDSVVTREGQDYLFIDTAGIRRKRSITRKLEQFAVVAAFNSIDRADIALLVLDGVTPPTDQDTRIAAMAHDKGKGLVIVINKWDLVENPEWREAYMLTLRNHLPFAEYAPLVTVSAKTGKGMKNLFKHVVAAQQERHRRITTGELNRFFREVVNSHPPPLRGGRRPQLYYVSQPMVRPPTFVFASNLAHDLHFSYVRYLQNSLRKRYGFVGSPIWLKFRPRTKSKTA